MLLLSEAGPITFRYECLLVLRVLLKASSNARRISIQERGKQRRRLGEHS